jgi:hypothetical protein
MSKLIGGAAALTLLVGCASTAPAPAELAAADGEKVVCKYEIVTGSNRKERICATEATWAEANEIRREQAMEGVFPRGIQRGKGSGQCDSQDTRYFNQEYQG